MIDDQGLIRRHSGTILTSEAQTSIMYQQATAPKRGMYQTLEQVYATTRGWRHPALLNRNAPVPECLTITE